MFLILAFTAFGLFVVDDAVVIVVVGVAACVDHDVGVLCASMDILVIIIAVDVDVVLVVFVFVAVLVVRLSDMGMINAVSFVVVIVVRGTPTGSVDRVRRAEGVESLHCLGGSCIRRLVGYVRNCSQHYR